MPADALHRVHARHAQRRCAIRAAAGPGVAVEKEMHALPVGKGELRREREARTQRVAILAFGSMVQPALEAAEELDATVANMRFVKPLDDELVVRARAHARSRWSRVEENVVAGGAGSAVAEALAEQGIDDTAPAARAARSLRRSWRPGAAARRTAASTPRASPRRLRSASRALRRAEASRRPRSSRPARSSRLHERSSQPDAMTRRTALRYCNEMVRP